MRTLLVAVLMAVVTGAPARAEVYEDKSVPIYVQTPPGFTIRTGADSGYDLVLNIDPVGNFPSRAAGEAHLCGIRYKVQPSQYTQEAINARVNDQAVQAQARVPIAAVLNLKTERMFTLGEVAGLEYFGTMREEPTAVSLLSVIVTPRGRVQIACFLPADQAEKALPVLRSIRDSIRPPK